ncbi:MAG: hypothetical protein ACJ790_04830, partial [Myxococcaceae bacterium]
MKRTLLVALFFCAAGCKKDEGPSPEAVDQAASLKPLAVVVPVDAGAPPVANAAADVDSDRDASEDVAAEP